VVEGEAASVEADATIGEAWGDSVGSAEGEFVGEAETVSVDSDGGIHPANMELAAIKLPVTEVISFNASRRDNLPSS